MSKRSKQGAFRQRKGRPDCCYAGARGNGDEIRRQLDDRIDKAMIDYLQDGDEVVDFKTCQPASGGVPAGRKIVIIGGTK